MLQVTSCVFIHLFSVHATNVNEYLYEKLRQSKIEVIKIHIQETSPGKFMYIYNEFKLTDVLI